MMALKCKLEETWPGYEGTAWVQTVLPDQPVLIGRHKHCTWMLPDPMRRLALKHAEISWDPEAKRYVLLDLSSQGVFVNHNEQPVGKGRSCFLQDGDTVRMGPYTWQMHVQKNAGRAPAVSSARPKLDPGRLQDVIQKGCFGHQNAHVNKLMHVLLEALGLQPERFEGRVDPLALTRMLGFAVQRMMGNTQDFLFSCETLKRTYGIGVAHQGSAAWLRGADPHTLLADVLEGDHLYPSALDEMLQDAFQAMKDHQVALLFGMDAALQSVVKHFDPRNMAKSFDCMQQGFAFRVGQKSKKARYWDKFLSYYPKMRNDAAAYAGLFHEQLAKAYGRQIRKMQKLHGTATKHKVRMEESVEDVGTC